MARTSAEDGKALAQQLDTGEFAGLAPYGSLTARTVLLHSLAFNEPLKGLGRLELNYSLYAPGLDPAFIDKAVRLLQEASEYLDDSITSKLRFLTEANLNQMVRKREGQFDLETVRQELNRHIGVIFTKARQCFEPVVFPASPAEIPDDTDGPYLVVLHWEGHRVAQDSLHLPELVVRLFKERGDNANTRRNRNNLVFVCAEALATAPRCVRIPACRACRTVHGSTNPAGLGLGAGGQQPWRRSGVTHNPNTPRDAGAHRQHQDDPHPVGPTGEQFWQGDPLPPMAHEQR